MTTEIKDHPLVTPHYGDVPRVLFYCGRDIMCGPDHYMLCVKWGRYDDVGEIYEGMSIYKHCLAVKWQAPRFRFERY